MTMDLGHLRYAIAVAEFGSFRRAAEALCVRQSSVSRAIQRFEDKLGVSLFQRCTTGALLTDAGRRLLCEARPALEQLEMARTMAEAAGRAEIGTLRVGILTSLADGFLRELIRRYIARHPAVTIDIRDGGRDEHVTAIRSRRLDVAFVTGDPRIAECEISTLWEERIHVVLPSSHKLADRPKVDWCELEDERFIVSSSAPGPQVYSYLMRRGPECGLHPEITHKSVMQETLMNLVALGQGITLIAAPWASVKLPDLVLRPLADSADVVAFSAVWSPRNDNPALRRFISIAHMLAGRARRGSSDWASDVSGLIRLGSGPSASAQTPDPSP